MAHTIYESEGTKQNLTPLIIMHGILASRKTWANAALRLESELHRKVYSVDLRNHGNSAHLSEHTYHHMAEDLLNFMIDKKIPKAMLLGHGMGGCVIMYFALKHPSVVERGIVIDVVPLSAPRGRKEVSRILLAMRNAKVSAHLDADKVWDKIQLLIEQVAHHPELVSSVMSSLKSQDNGNLYWSVNIEVLLANLKELSNLPIYIKSMSPFQGPMLFLCDNYSEFINTKNWPMVNIIFPNSEIVWLNINQLAYIDQSEQFFNLVIAFLNKTQFE